MDLVIENKKRLHEVRFALHVHYSVETLRQTGTWSSHLDQPGTITASGLIKEKNSNGQKQFVAAMKEIVQWNGSNDARIAAITKTTDLSED